MRVVMDIKTNDNVLNKDMSDELKYLKEIISENNLNNNETVLISYELLKYLILNSFFN